MSSASSVELRRFTRDEFLRMIEMGLFRADEHLELLHGRLIVVPPQGPPHTYSSSILRDRLPAAYNGQASVREDKALDCGEEELPEPDLAVVRGTHRDYA
jgi:Uma2 family endonuclease